MTGGSTIYLPRCKKVVLECVRNLKNAIEFGVLECEKLQWVSKDLAILRKGFILCVCYGRGRHRFLWWSCLEPCVRFLPPSPTPRLFNLRKHPGIHKSMLIYFKHFYKKHTYMCSSIMFPECATVIRFINWVFVYN